MIKNLLYGVLGLVVLILASLVALGGMVLDPIERAWWAKREGR